MRKEKIIFDNRSSRPLYESYEKAFDFYFQYYDEGCSAQVLSSGNFRFYMTTNKDSITIKFFDA